MSALYPISAAPESCWLRMAHSVASYCELHVHTGMNVERAKPQPVACRGENGLFYYWLLQKQNWGLD